MPYSGTKQTLMNFNIKKRSQFVKTFPLSIHIVILDEKKLKIFLGMEGQTVRFFFYLFKDVKSHEKLVRDNEFVGKGSIGGILAIFF